MTVVNIYSESIKYPPSRACQIMKKTIITLVAISIFGCNSSPFESDSGFAFEDKLAIVEGELYSIELDSVTPTESNFLKIYNVGGLEQLVFLNYLDNTLIFYDYQTGAVSNKLYFPTKGPGYLGELESFEIINEDSIFVVSAAIHAGFYDWQGKLLSKIEKVDYNIKLTPLTTSGNPPVLHENKLYQSGFFLGSRDHNITMVSSLEKDSSYSIYQIPEIYRQGFWGPGEYDMHFHCYNQELGLFIYSFPQSTNIFVTNHKGKNEEYYGGSKYFGEIFPISSKQLTSYEEVMDLTLVRPIFQEIIYDKYKKVYYRIAEHALSEIEAEAISDPYLPGVRDFSIVVFDADFNKVGESNVFKRGQYDSRIFFVNTNGLQIKKLDREAEDKLWFRIFSVSPKKT